MRCANPECGRTADDIRYGILRRLELDVRPDERTTGSDTGFPVCSVQSRYFWLCEECSKTLSIRKWTADGIVLAACGSGSRLSPAKALGPASVSGVFQRSRRTQVA